MPTTIINLETRRVCAKIIKELEAIIANHRLASEVIKTANIDLALEVLENDKIIDAIALDVEAELEFLITKAPVDRDLRRTLAYISIARELERVGDYAKHIAKFVIKQKGKIAKSSVVRITSVHDLFSKMLSQLGKLIENEDFDETIALARMDKEVDELVLDTRMNVIQSISRKDNLEQVNERVFVLNTINSLERASDHIVNICEMIVYIATGNHSHLV